MGLKIHEYALERLSLGDDDFVDIDYFNGSDYESAKIKGQVFKSIVASEPNIVIVQDSADLPANLQANTTYIINGEVTTSQAVTIAQEGTCIIGRDRNKDALIYTGTGAFLTITNVNFMLREVKISATNSASSIISATNVSATGYNFDRLKTLALNSCQFRNCYDLFDIKGFDLVDINNCLFWYIQAQNFGLKFQDTSKIELSSCEIIRWFDESTIPTPSNFSIVSMIELDSNNFASFGAINISGCVIHPQDVQNGIEINSGATIGFGTIASNTFVDTNLSGEKFLPVVSPGLPDYSQAYTNNIDVFVNQGLLNSTSGVISTMNGNVNDTAFASVGTPVIVQVGGGGTAPVVQSAVRYSLNASTGRLTYTGTKIVYVSLHCSLSYEKQGGGSGNEYEFFFYKNGSLLPGSSLKVEGASGAIGSLTMTYGVLMENNDYIELYVANNTATNGMLVRDYQLLIRE